MLGEQQTTIMVRVRAGKFLQLFPSAEMAGDEWVRVIEGRPERNGRGMPVYGDPLVRMLDDDTFQLSFSVRHMMGVKVDAMQEAADALRELGVFVNGHATEFQVRQTSPRWAPGGMGAQASRW